MRRILKRARDGQGNAGGSLKWAPTEYQCISIHKSNMLLVICILFVDLIF